MNQNTGGSGTPRGGDPEQPHPKSPEEWAQVMRALSEKPRLRIIRVLLEGSKCVSDISQAADLKIYNASRHLKTLREAGLLVSTRQGTEIHFDLSPYIRDRLRGNGRTLDLGCCQFDFDKLNDEID